MQKHLIIRQCQICGADFYLTYKRRPDARFCNRICSDIHRAKLLSRPLAERFWPKVNKTIDCWLWTASLTKNGYGQIGRGGHNTYPLYAHRVSWELHNGPIPDGLSVLHKCDVRNCVRPDHLFLGTLQDNMDDMVAKGRQSRGTASNLNTKFTEADIIAIRERCVMDKVSRREVAKEFGTTHRYIADILTGRRWKHVQ